MCPNFIGNRFGCFFVRLRTFELHDTGLQGASDGFVNNPRTLKLPVGRCPLVFCFKCHE
ncbi:hypothetical protein SAMN06273572_104187 [Monaibacterium marinum]|uniref:Uncharacterized protein n=1 Tax=Pontivivens marinum TaxID=1690039 RepID=A0A2C9CTD1_9RHOB|nr:hypothetical protein SAMN06273572_104187 [Monaibacterium marinum]